MLKINKKLYLELKAIASFEEESLNDVLNNVIGEGIRCYENRNGAFCFIIQKEKNIAKSKSFGL